MRVFLHTRTKATWDWQNEYQELARIPIVGEYLALAPMGPWYQAQLVVHTPFERGCDAELYSIEVDIAEAKKLAFSDLKER
jgi:hypothetical protein